MRSAPEIAQMIAELRREKLALLRAGKRGQTHDVAIALLRNVLYGPRRPRPGDGDDCACMGPPDLCLCKIQFLLQPGEATGAEPVGHQSDTKSAGPNPTD